MGRVALRICGVKPASVEERTDAVKRAVRELERIGASFTVADVAERSGVSRATIYRSSELRSLIGAKGDSERTVPLAQHEAVIARYETQRKKSRDLRCQLKEADDRWDEMRLRAKNAEASLESAKHEIQSLLNRINVLGTSRTSGRTLNAIAARLGSEKMRQARRQLARALHPDLFANSDAAAELATELLKLLNAASE